jgi:hypothetical protein
VPKSFPQFEVSWESSAFAGGSTVDGLVEQAKAAGASEELDVTRFVHLGLDLGPDFPDRPAWIAETLSWNQPPAVRLEAIEDGLRREQARAAGFES